MKSKRSTLKYDLIAQSMPRLRSRSYRIQENKTTKNTKKGRRAKAGKDGLAFLLFVLFVLFVVKFFFLTSIASTAMNSRVS
jgi:hypothetical protein